MNIAKTQSDIMVDTLGKAKKSKKKYKTKVKGLEGEVDRLNDQVLVAKYKLSKVEVTHAKVVVVAQVVDDIGVQY